jgi:hypothetical protein
MKEIPKYESKKCDRIIHKYEEGYVSEESKEILKILDELIDARNFILIKDFLKIAGVTITEEQKQNLRLLAQSFLEAGKLEDALYIKEDLLNELFFPEEIEEGLTSCLSRLRLNLFNYNSFDLSFEKKYDMGLMILHRIQLLSEEELGFCLDSWKGAKIEEKTA